MISLQNMMANAQAAVSGLQAVQASVDAVIRAGASKNSISSMYSAADWSFDQSGQANWTGAQNTGTSFMQAWVNEYIKKKKTALQPAPQPGAVVQQSPDAVLLRQAVDAFTATFVTGASGAGGATGSPYITGFVTGLSGSGSITLPPSPATILGPVGSTVTLPDGTTGTVVLLPGGIKGIVGSAGKQKRATVS